MITDSHPFRAALVATVLVVASARFSAAQTLPEPDPARPAAAQGDAADQATAQPVNPWADRPVCASMFLKADFQLTKKQRVCQWIHNGVFSTTAMLGAAWSAGFSIATDSSSEEGDSFMTRFGRKFGQNAFKSTGSYLGGFILREDPRLRPPYLALRNAPKPRGFWARTGSALGNNFISYRCTGDCTCHCDVKKVFALSRITGSLASGVGGELMTTDRPRTANHALRGAASAYASTFVNSLFVEFKPELSAFGGKAFRAIFGGK